MINVGDIIEYSESLFREYTLKVEDLEWTDTPNPNSKIWVSRVDTLTYKTYHIRYSVFKQKVESGSMRILNSPFFVKKRLIKKHSLL